MTQRDDAAIACVRFASLRAFEGALRAGLVRVSARALGVRVKRDGDALLVDVTCLEEVTSAMPIEHTLGLVTHASWFEVLPPTRSGSPPDGDEELLFVGPEDAMRPWLVQLLSWGAEGVRAACVGADVWVLARRTPAYLQMLAEDAKSAADVRAFARAQGDVYFELGWSHALASWVRAEGEFVLIDRTGKVRRASAPHFERTVESVGIARLDTSQVATPSSAKDWLRALEIRPRLRRAVRERSPTLWWVQRDAVKQLDAWVSSAGEGALGHYEVQVLTQGEDVSVLVRGLVLDADAAVPLEALELAALEGAPRLFAPVNKRLDPPLHEARVLASLDAEARRDISYVLQQDGEVLRAQPFLQVDFSPLHAWTRIHLERAKAKLASWASAMHVELEELDVLSTSELASHVSEPQELDRTKRKRTRTTKVRATKPSSAQPAEHVQNVGAAVHWTMQAPTEAAVAALESNVLLRGVSLGDEANSDALAKLAAARRSLDAGASLEALTLDAWRWIGQPHAAYLDETAALHADLGEGPMRDALQAISLDARAPAAVRGALARGLTERAALLPAPVLMLALQRLVDVSGGDDVLRARMRDLLRPRLSLGLEVGLDVPAFLRREATLSTSLTQVQRGHLLGQFLSSLEAMKRTESALEAPWSKTLRWARWLVAIGYARLGLRQESEALQRGLMGEEGDALEAALAAVAHERWASALRGAPQVLSVEVLRLIDGLEERSREGSQRELYRYKFDRVLGALSLLGENTRDAFRAFAEGTDAQGDLAHALANAPDAATQVVLFDRELALHADAQEHDLALVDALLILPASSARPRVEPLVARAISRPPAHAIRTLSALARSVRIWGDDAERGELRNALKAMRALHNAEVMLEALGTHADLLDVLLRHSDGSVAAPFATWLEEALLEETVSTEGRLAVLAKLAAVGASQAGLEAELQRALTRLKAKGDARLKLVRALVHALLAMDASRAAPVLDAIHACIGGTTDAYQTSSHLCLSVLAMVDAVVLPVSELRNVEGERVRWKSAHHLGALLRPQGHGRNGDDEA